MAYQDVFTALADPTRRGLFESLKNHPKSVGELSRGLPISRPAVSQHLRVLEKANLVNIEPSGTKRLYSIRKEGLDELRRYADMFWDDVLTAYSKEVDRRVKMKKKKQRIK